jgi:hypothetical protein
MMPMVLAIDHRVLDGADALNFTKVLIDSLEDPEELLMTMPLIRVPTAAAAVAKGKE